MWQLLWGLLVDDIILLLVPLHWLPRCFQAQFKVLVITFKALYSLVLFSCCKTQETKREECHSRGDSIQQKSPTMGDPSYLWYAYSPLFRPCSAHPPVLFCPCCWLTNIGKSSFSCWQCMGKHDISGSGSKSVHLCVNICNAIKLGIFSLDKRRCLQASEGLSHWREGGLTFSCSWGPYESQLIETTDLDKTCGRIS